MPGPCGIGGTGFPLWVLRMGTLMPERQTPFNSGVRGPHKARRGNDRGYPLPPGPEAVQHQFEAPLEAGRPPGARSIAPALAACSAISQAEGVRRDDHLGTVPVGEHRVAPVVAHANPSR